MKKDNQDIDPQETKEWIESVEDILNDSGQERLRFLLGKSIEHAELHGTRLPFSSVTPFINTIKPQEQKQFPGDRAIERRI